MFFNIIIPTILIAVMSFTTGCMVTRRQHNSDNDMPYEIRHAAELHIIYALEHPEDPNYDMNAVTKLIEELYCYE